MADGQIRDWEQRLERIASDVETIRRERFVYERIIEIVRANPILQGTESLLWGYLLNTYAKTQAVAIRRQADTDPRVASLGRVICGVAESPELLTREWWIGLSERDDPSARRLLEGDWESLYAGEVGDHLDPAIPGADLATLRHVSKKVKRFVNRNLAHLKARPISDDADRLDESQIHDAIDLIGDLFGKYWGLFKAQGWTSLTPAPQEDWEAPFRTAWIPPKRDD